jgi:hypothetical protein
MFIQDPDPGSRFLPITDPGSGGQKAARSRIRNTAFYPRAVMEYIFCLSAL